MTPWNVLWTICHLYFSKSAFSKIPFRNTIRVSNSFDPDQAWHNVEPDLGPNCLQRLSADKNNQASQEAHVDWPAIHTRATTQSHALFNFYTLPLKCGGVLCYTFRCLSVRPFVRPCSPFPIDNLSIYSRNFFKFCLHIVISDEWYGIVNGQNPSIFNGVTALFRIGKMVSGLLFLYCSWYLNETSQICCTSKVTYCD